MNAKRFRRVIVALAVLVLAGSGFAARALAAKPAPAAGVPHVRMPDPSTMSTYVFAILARGPSWTPGSTPHTDSIQAGHMANIHFMHDRGLLLGAGPFLQDGPRRGIFLFRDVPQETLAPYLDLDPAIRSGRLKFDIHRWYAPRGIGEAYEARARVRTDNPDSMLVLPLVFLRTPAHYVAKDSIGELRITAGHLGHIVDMLLDGRLLAAGPFSDDGEYRGVCVFGTDSTTARRLAMDDPAVKAGRLEVEMLPWMTAWGVMPPQPRVKEEGK